MLIASHPHVELVPLSRRRRMRVHRLLRSVCVTLGVLVLVGLILPVALGMSGHTVSDDAMSGSLPEGSLVFTKPVPVADLVVGDLITFQPPNSSGVGEVVTRRISAIEGAALTTARDVDGAVDPWTLRPVGMTQARVVLDVPLVGFAAELAPGSSTAWIVGIPLLMLALCGLTELLLRRSAGPAHPPVAPV